MKKNKTKQHLPSFLFFRHHFTPNCSVFSLLSCAGDGKWELWRVHNSSSATPSSSHCSPAPAQVPSMSCSPSWTSPPWSLHRLQGDTLLHHGPLQGNLCFGTCSTSFFSDLGVCRSRSYIFPHMLSLRCHHLGWGAQLCPAMGSLELAVSSMGQPRFLVTEAALQAPPQHLAVDTQCNDFHSDGQKVLPEGLKSSFCSL